MIEIGLLVCIVLVALALKMEESLPEERQVQEKFWERLIQMACGLLAFFLYCSFVISVIGGTNG